MTGERPDEGEKPSPHEEAIVDLVCAVRALDRIETLAGASASQQHAAVARVVASARKIVQGCMANAPPESERWIRERQAEFERTGR